MTGTKVFLVSTRDIPINRPVSSIKDSMGWTSPCLLILQSSDALSIIPERRTSWLGGISTGSASQTRQQISAFLLF